MLDAGVGLKLLLSCRLWVTATEAAQDGGRKRGEHRHLLLPAAWVALACVRGCGIGFYPERHI